MESMNKFLVYVVPNAMPFMVFALWWVILSLPLLYLFSLLLGMASIVTPVNVLVMAGITIILAAKSQLVSYIFGSNKGD